MSEGEIYPSDSEEGQIISLVKAGDWKSLLAKHTRNRFLPWIWPNLEDLQFIAESARLFGCKSVVSIGCGSALLEWMIQQATGMPVKGVEVDHSWWTSKYNKSFLPLEFAEGFTKSHPAAEADDALFFCYFNNELAFIDYCHKYNGNCLIGPGPERGTHTDPTPFRLPYPVCEAWELHERREISSAHDFTAVFKRIIS